MLARNEEMWMWKDSRGGSVDEKGKKSPELPYSGPLLLVGLRRVPSQ